MNHGGKKLSPKGIGFFFTRFLLFFLLGFCSDFEKILGWSLVGFFKIEKILGSSLLGFPLFSKKYSVEL